MVVEFSQLQDQEVTIIVLDHRVDPEHFPYEILVRDLLT